MPRKPTSQFGMGPLKRFVVRKLLPFLLRPFEGAAEQRSLTDGLKQIAGTLRAMGVLPEDPIVKQIGSEFQLLFCGAAPPDKMKSRQDRHGRLGDATLPTYPQIFAGGAHPVKADLVGADLRAAPGRGSLIGPAESISDLLRESPPQTRSSTVAGALRRFAAFCRRPSLSRPWRSSL
jgi:hypothetical protein